VPTGGKKSLHTKGGARGSSASKQKTRGKGGENEENQGNLLMQQGETGAIDKKK